jgi:hypothetical protein
VGSLQPTRYVSFSSFLRCALPHVVTLRLGLRNGGDKLSWVTDKLFRTGFLAVYSSVFFLPVWRLVLPVQLLPVCLLFYLPSYLDGAEQREGRKSMRVQQHWFWHWLKRRSPSLPSLNCLTH